jgi:hypothetical protein
LGSGFGTGGFGSGAGAVVVVGAVVVAAGVVSVPTSGSRVSPARARDAAKPRTKTPSRKSELPRRNRDAAPM